MKLTTPLYAALIAAAITLATGPAMAGDDDKSGGQSSEGQKSGKPKPPPKPPKPTGDDRK
jgi:hypothetical protein